MTYRTWEQLSETEQYQSIFSDIHKDVYGYRPRWQSTEQWNSLEWLKEQVAELEDALLRQEEEKVSEEAAAIEAFEARVLGTRAAGAPDRETAIRWIAEAYEIEGDWDYLCYQLGLPYGYFKDIGDE